jgi:hypothetical protein
MIDIDEGVLLRLATLGPPSLHALAFGNRRDVVLEAEADMQFDAALARFRREQRVRLACIVRRLRREFAP